MRHFYGGFFKLNDRPQWVVTALYGWEPTFFGLISPNREGATPPKDNSPPQRVVPPLEDIHHPQSMVTNLKTFLKMRILFLLYLGVC